MFTKGRPLALGPGNTVMHKEDREGYAGNLSSKGPQLPSRSQTGRCIKIVSKAKSQGSTEQADDLRAMQKKTSDDLKAQQKTYDDLKAQQK